MISEVDTVPKSEVFLEDCMIGMARYPDKYFDLAIVDPPYGLGKRLTDGGGNHLKFKNFKEIQQWDTVPDRSYFTELFRISRDQIIWGGNYFDLGPSRGYAIWDKMQSVPNFSATEYAWTSYDCPSRIFRYRQAGCFGESKIHPTQKPVDLYKWLIDLYGNMNGYRSIVDTHLGSGSSRIAALEMGYSFTGFEISPDYFNAQEKRFSQHKSQLRLGI